ncbi:hypothetical protein [Pseudooceanicola sp. HF7]|nr:hypothetical protein [Pseudooceanicola sp. HF7]
MAAKSFLCVEAPPGRATPVFDISGPAVTGPAGPIRRRGGPE